VADHKCGEPNGGPCSTPPSCRSGICDGTDTCVAQCAKDSDCGAGTYCDATSHTCVAAVPNGQQPPGTGPCTRGAQCLSGVCDADGTCGEPVGETCGAPTICRDGVCDPNDAKCGLANGDGPCTAQNQSTACRSGVCDNGKCGFANGDGPCTTNAQCDSNKCDTSSQKCVGCLGDSDCKSGNFCDKPTGTCKPALGDGSPCDRPAQCTSAECTSGACGSGATDGGADGSSGTDAGADATVTDASTPHDASTSTDASTHPAADGSSADASAEDLGVQGGGCNCTSAPGHDDAGTFAFGGVVALAGLFALRRRRRAG
jgi:MYXO-CTERM domain-containing protein